MREKRAKTWRELGDESAHLGLERLERLADHLEQGKLSVKELRMDCWRKVKEERVCGCPGGECVRLWPEYWRFVRSLMGQGWWPVLRGLEPVGSLTHLGIFFHLSVDEALALFAWSDRWWTKSVAAVWQQWGGRALREKENRQDLALNFRRFIAWRKRELKSRRGAEGAEKIRSAKSEIRSH